MKLLSFLSSTVEAGKRSIKAWNGKSDTRTAKQYSAYGMDSNPIKGTTLLYGRTELDGAEAIFGSLNKDCLAEPGETRLFCTDEAGAFKFNIWLRADGTIFIGDSKVPAAFTNFAVKYNELKLEYDKTALYLTTLRTATQAALVAVDAVVPGTSAAFIAAMAGQVVGNITTSKNDKVKFN